MANQSTYPMTHTKHTSQLEAADQGLSIESLLGEHYSYILRLAISILDDRHEAEDAVQETFISAHRSLSGFRHEADPKTWLAAITVNACRGRLRKRKLRQTLTSTLQSLHLLKPDSPTPEQQVIQDEVDQKIWQAVDELDDKHKITVILRYVHGLNVPDIARILHLSQGTIHSRLYYARQKLHGRLRHLDPRQEVTDGPTR